MRLGVLMAGEGVGALGAIGVLRAIMRKGIAVEAVCGMDMGAYPAALWACGMRVEEMQRCAEGFSRHAGKLMDYDKRLLLTGRGDALLRGTVIARLLNTQTNGMALRDCGKAAAFVCMAAPGRRTVIFSPREKQTSCAVWTDHAPVWFAARAAMATAPLMRAANFIGIPLCAHPDVREGIRALKELDATHILTVYPSYVRAVPRTPLDLSAWEKSMTLEHALQGWPQVRVELPETITPARFDEAAACIRAGERCGARLERADLAEASGKIVYLYR